MTSWVGGLYGAMFLCSACHSRTAETRREECAPVTSVLSASSTAVGLAGEYELKLVAASGAKAGTATQGALTLRPQSAALRYRARPGGARDTTVVHPLYGSADLDLTAVDAVEVGSTTSSDPMQPGVLVIERHQRPGQAPLAEIVLRLGSDANRQDRQRVDGGYTALHVRQLSAEGFSGTWGSGVTGERSAGYFCAVRKDGKDVKDGEEE
jgi:hypothetical protein